MQNKGYYIELTGNTSFCHRFGWMFVGMKHFHMHAVTVSSVFFKPVSPYCKYSLFTYN